MNKIRIFLILFGTLVCFGCVTQDAYITRGESPSASSASSEKKSSSKPPADHDKSLVSHKSTSEEPMQTPAQDKSDNKAEGKIKAVREGETEKPKQAALGAAKPAGNVTEKNESAVAEDQTKAERVAPSTAGNVAEKPPSSSEPEIKQRSQQEILDSALEFCQASNDFWEQGDLENALAALDKSYSLILQVNGDHSPEILQQRDDLRITISKRIIEVYSSRFTVANGDHKAIPLLMNRHVERALKLFKGRDRKFFLQSYHRSGLYRPFIVEALREAGLPEEISWLPLIESGFKLRALSRARALGLWQFIASTGYKFGLKRDRWIDERMDPEKATKAAIDYLKELHRIFGDWTTALAAYNCGEGNVLKRIKTQRINYLDNFWDLYEKLPRETAFYVPKFLAVLHILNDPEYHGFTLPTPATPIEKEKVTISKPVHLKAISKHLDIPYKTLKDLNPALKRYSTPNQPYLLNVPLGKGSALLAKIDEIPIYEPPVAEYVVHRVRRGESLSVIAGRYRTSVRAIAKMNRLRSRHLIRTGQRLKVPTRRYVSRKKTRSSFYRPVAGGIPTKYQVRKGDSLWKIAQRFGTTTKAILDVNRLSEANLSIGQVLIVPGGTTSVSTVDTKKYTVIEGDSPYLIAEKNQMSLSSFLRLNNLTPRSKIFPGQTLMVKAN